MGNSVILAATDKTPRESTATAPRTPVGAGRSPTSTGEAVETAPHRPQPPRSADSRSPTEPASAVHEVYLSSEWYAPVDERGMVASSCAEGALGYIVQLYATEHLLPANQKAALKIPRLRADTIAENAYICQILSGEAASVFKAQAAKRKQGLVQVTATRRADLLRSPRDLAHDAVDKIREQAGCIPFIHFAKDQRVAICNVKYEPPSPDGDGKPSLRVFPATMTPAFSFFRYEHWQQLQKAMAPGTLVPHRSFYFPVGIGPGERSRGTAEGSEVGLLDQQLNTETSAKIWYAYLPSIVFEWADCTLQRTLSTRSHASWRLKQHYQLLTQVVTGLRALHSENIIHADVRPANVMAIGEPDNPEHYLLCDYGSFTNDQATAGGGNTGHTTMPGVARHRASFFYANERRAGVEREDSDVALIIAEAPGQDHSPGEYFIRLGWKANFFDANSNRIYPAVIADMEAAWAAMRERSGSERSAVGDPGGRDTWRLTEGDQIRLGDYVFKLIDCQESKREISRGGSSSSFRCLDFRCASSYTQVYLEKLAVRGSSFLLERSANRQPRTESSVLSLDLPRWVEIRQSSVASDLYSVGVMALYTLHTGVGAAHGGEGDSGETRPVAARDDDAALDVAEEPMGGLIRRLEDEKNFNVYWPDLTRVCFLIEAAVRAGLPLAELMALPVESEDAIPDDKPARTFKDLVENLLAELCNLSRELQAIQAKINNYGYFLLYLHFVLSCMHRRSHLDSYSLEKLQFEKTITIGGRELTPLDDAVLYPFCRDRCEKTPHRTTVVEKVHARLQRLLTYFDQRLFFREFHALLSPNTANQRASPGDTVEARRMRSLRQDNATLKSEVTHHAEQARLAHEREAIKSKEAQRQIDQERDRLQKEVQHWDAEHRQHIERLEWDNRHLQDTQRQTEAHLVSLRGYTQNLVQFLKGLPEECRQYSLLKLKLPDEILSKIDALRRDFEELDKTPRQPRTPTPSSLPLIPPSTVWVGDHASSLRPTAPMSDALTLEAPDHLTPAALPPALDDFSSAVTQLTRLNIQLPKS